MAGPLVVPGVPSLTDYRSDKLEAAILFFLEWTNNRHLGRTKLMKLLYYADFDHMEQFGMPITAATYIKLPQGPVPSEAFLILESMEASGKIAMETQGIGQFQQYRYEELANPDLTLFDPKEQETLEGVAIRWKNARLSDIVAATHDEIPWLSTQPNQAIRYELAEFRKSPLMAFGR